MNCEMTDRQGRNQWYRCNKPNAFVISIAVTESGFLIVAGHLVRVPPKEAWTCEEHALLTRESLIRDANSEVLFLAFQNALTSRKGD